jgi:hypothetical protein
VGENFIWFGGYGTFILQGYHTKVTFQLKDKHFPYMMGQHYMANKINLVVLVFSNLLMVSKLEDFFIVLVCFFLSSLKHHMEFPKVVVIMETKGFKVLKKIQIQWISMLEPLKWILTKYKMLIVKMTQDNISVAQARLNINLFCDLHTLLTLLNVCWRQWMFWSNLLKEGILYAIL